MPVLYVRTFSGHFTKELQRVRKILLEPISLDQRRVQNGFRCLPEDRIPLKISTAFSKWHTSIGHCIRLLPL